MPWESSTNWALALGNSLNFFRNQFSHSENGKIELDKMYSTLQIKVTMIL